jgi:hypothetical protein
MAQVIAGRALMFESDSSAEKSGSVQRRPGSGVVAGVIDRVDLGKLVFGGV